ncbi:MAG: helix-turn-helix transcriptional regulator [Deltaproteobacteria bacterium]|nr:helix-turn-helix transcriptional regulator [Deltaproteobacteria bacterium]
MRTNKTEKLLSDASELAILRIRRDRERAPAPLKPLFSCIEKHLFESTFNVSDLMRRCGKRDKSSATQFSRCVLMAPHEYITEARIQTAIELLSNTDLEIWKIAALVGFSNNSILFRNFKFRLGVGPLSFRKDKRKTHRQREEEILSDPPGERKIANTIAPTNDSAVAPNAPIEMATVRNISGSSLQEEKFEGIWEVLREKNWCVQREIIRDRLRFSTPEFFHFLHQKSIFEGRRNREYGVHVTELAIEALGVIEQISGEFRPDLRCQGWEWVGNARRLALDFVGAEKAFLIAEPYLKQLSGQPQIHAQFYRRKAALRRWQRRLVEALRLNLRALTLFSSIDRPKAMVETLLESANIHEHAGELMACNYCLREAIGILDRVQEDHLKFAAYYNLTSVNAKIGNYEESAKLLDTVRRLGANRDQDSHIDWLEGFVAAGLDQAELAETFLLRAFQGFETSRKIGYAAMAAMDLALLYTRQNRSSEARHLALLSLPILESLGFHDEAQVAVGLLSSGISENTITEAVLRQVRERLDELRLDPTIEFDKVKNSLNPE